jgi:glutamate synthase domain-containing protein 3
MKEYKDKKSTIVVGGTAQDFVGEYMAGGILILLGMTLRRGKSHRAKFIGTGMHGGVIYIRGKVEEYQLGKEVGVAKPDESDTQVLRKLVGEFASYFNYDAEEILQKDFIKLYPRSLRPYGRLYAY